MTWISATPALLTAALMIVGPGLTLGWCLRLRGLELYALAPILSASIVAASAVCYSFLRIPWNPLTLLPVVVVFCVLGLVTTGKNRIRRPSLGEFWSRSGPTVIGLGLGAVILVQEFMRVFGGPDHISQTADNIFHLNAIRYIVETGSASSLTVGNMTGIPFYPAVWHSFGALIFQASGAPIPVTVAALTIVSSALVWPAGLLYLTRQILPRSVVSELFVGVVAAGYPAHPLLLAKWGVLYPNQLSITFLPAMIALLVQALGLGAKGTRYRVKALVLLGVGAPGLALTHPGAAMALIAFAWPLALIAAPRFLRLLEARKIPVRWSLSALAVIFCVLLAITVSVWLLLRPDAQASIGPPVQTMAQALGQVVFGAPMGASVSDALSIAFVIGIVFLARRRSRRWPLALYAVAAFLFVTVSSSDRVPFREFITGVWYNDAFRMAALLPLTMVPIALVGLHVFVAWATRIIKRRIESGPRTFGLARLARIPEGRRGSVVTLAILLLVVGDTQGGNMRQAVWDAQPSYFLNSHSELLTSDEAQLLSRVGANVPKDAVIAGNPWTGTALVYAYSGRRVPELHVLSNVGDDVRLVNSSLRWARSMPAVCDAVHRLGIEYVLDFGLDEFHNYHHSYAGLYHLAEDGLATVIDRQGDAKLLRLTACGP